jgi:hypothetical protein
LFKGLTVMGPEAPLRFFPREQAEINGKAASMARSRSTARRFMENLLGFLKEALNKPSRSAL